MPKPNMIFEKNIRQKPPFLFKIAHAGINHNFKGSWKFLKLLQNTILKDQIVAFTLPPANHDLKPVTLFAPIGRPESSKPYEIFEKYEAFIVEDIARILNNRKTKHPICYVDAGADIGMVAAQMLRYIHGLSNIYAFEPNDIARPYLKAMLENHGVNHQVFSSAVGNRNARGQMVSPENDPSDHACFFQESADGPVEMSTISSLIPPTGKSVVIKVDVEGAEYDVIEGAKTFLEQAEDFTISFEAHPLVIERTKIKPDDVVALLEEIRPCKLYLAGHPDVRFDKNKPIQDQIPEYDHHIHNLICTSIV